MCVSGMFSNPVSNAYSATECELMECVICIKKLDRYLYGFSFDLYTDHCPLLNIFSKRKFATRRLARMVMKLLDYDFKVYHIAGKDIKLADAISLIRLYSNDHELDTERKLVTLPLFVISM